MSTVLTADGPARGVIVHLNRDCREGEIKVNRTDRINDVIPFLYADVLLDPRYLSDIQLGLIVTFMIRTSKVQKDDKVIQRRRAINVVLAEDMEFNGVVSKIDYNDEKGEIHVEGLSTPLGFRLIHMPPDTEFSLVREGDSVRVEIGFWNFVCIRKPPLPNAVTLVGEAAKRQRNFKRSNATQPSNHRDGGDESPRIPRRPALRRAASNSNLEDKTDDSDVPEPRSRTRSLEDGFSRRAYKGVVGSTSVTSLSQDPFCHAPINPHVPICPGAPCMISQHTFPTGNLTDARAFQGWNTMRSACQAAGFPHTTHHSGGAGLYHSGLHHQQFLAHPAANFYQRNSSVYRNEPNLLVELNAIEPEPLRAQGGPSTGDDTIIEMTVNELRDVVRRARARQI